MMSEVDRGRNFQFKLLITSIVSMAYVGAPCLVAAAIPTPISMSIYDNPNVSIDLPCRIQYLNDMLINH